ncbi:MAG: septation ring formation regulator EzrA, partial [Bacilli bacterium]
ILYRGFYEKFKETESDYGDIREIIQLQFEIIAKKFEEYEKILENNMYNEVDKTLNSIDEMLKHMSVVIEEMPQIVLMSTLVLPKKIKEVLDEFTKLQKKGFPLDYLNVEYNIKEANLKIEDIKKRAKELNMEDSLLELKVLLDYFENTFNDFEKEKINKKEYEEISSSFEKKLINMNKLVTDIFRKLSSIKKNYNLDTKDIELLEKIKEELRKLNSDYKILIDNTNNNSFPFSKLNKEIENLSLRLKAIEESLDTTLDTIGSMKQDEVRARKQLEEIKDLLRKSRNFMREYEIPVIPKTYFVELKEAQSAIKEIIVELDKSPISIETLNVRVETAKDLVLKLFNKSKEIVKSAAFAEMTIVYGNRYRSNYDDLDKNLAYSEMLFFKGEYQKSLELSINSLNKIEPGIQKKLIEYYGK